MYQYCLVGAVGKNGSFGFAKRGLVCRAKPNVPFVRLEKLQFFCAWGKNLSSSLNRHFTIRLLGLWCVVIGFPLTFFGLAKVAEF